MLKKVLNWTMSLLPAVLVLAATVAMFLDMATLTEWATVCGILFGLWATSKGFQIVSEKVKK